MDDKVFPNQNRVPAIIGDIVAENGFEAMSPGETTWTVPWALDVDENGAVLVNVGMGERGHGPGGTAKLKLVSDFDGIFVDATALGRDDIEKYFGHRSDKGVIGWYPSALRPVGGVMYPLIRKSEGLAPADVKSFNAEQTATRKRFSEYYKATYGQEYVFAEQEVSTPRDYAATARTVGEIAATRRGRGRRGRWGR